MATLNAAFVIRVPGKDQRDVFYSEACLEGFEDALGLGCCGWFRVGFGLVRGRYSAGFGGSRDWFVAGELVQVWSSAGSVCYGMVRLVDGVGLGGVLLDGLGFI